MESGRTMRTVSEMAEKPPRDRSQFDQAVDQLRTIMSTSAELEGRTRELALRLRGHDDAPKNGAPANSAPTPVPYGHLAALADVIQTINTIHAAHQALLNELESVV